MLNSTTVEKFLAESDPHPVAIVNRGLPGPFLFTCDHACNRIPERLGDMGMTADQLSSHIAWDPGALPVALELASLFQSPLVYGAYSRLIVDLNRPPDSSGSMPVTSAGVPIPGNQGLSEWERRLRLTALFRPYHEAIDRLLSERLESSHATAVVAIHSFTPDYPGELRPWHVGVTHRRDFGLGTGLVKALRHGSDVLVGDNVPFQIQNDGDETIPRHGEQRCLPNVLIELRQDTLTTAADRDVWIKRLHQALRQALGARSPAAHAVD
jgi:predicted N-formylglutamate amidohydrolase